MLVNMSIDKNTLNRIIYIHKNQGQLNTLNQSRIFEKGNHELKELSDVKFTSIETKDFLKDPINIMISFGPNVRVVDLRLKISTQPSFLLTYTFYY